MSTCHYCNKTEDYTDQFAVILPGTTKRVAACWNCFQAYRNESTSQPEVTDSGCKCDIWIRGCTCGAFQREMAAKNLKETE